MNTRTAIVKSILIGLVLLCGMTQRSNAQSFEAQQLLLDWQKLTQEKQILTDLYKGYETLSAGYTAISDIAKGNFDLHKAFLDGLLAVSPAVRNYQRIKEIINLQLQIVASYKTAWSRFSQDKHFTPDELITIGHVYTGLFNQSANNLATLTTILTDGKLRAGDGERIRQIDGLYTDMNGTWQSLQAFNNHTAILSLQRSADENDYTQLRLWYGLNN